VAPGGVDPGTGDEDGRREGDGDGDGVGEGVGVGDGVGEGLGVGSGVGGGGSRTVADCGQFEHPKSGESAVPVTSPLPGYTLTAVSVTGPDNGGRNQLAPAGNSKHPWLHPAGCELGWVRSSMSVPVVREPSSGVTVMVQVTCVVLGVAWVGETLKSREKPPGTPAAVGLRARLDSIAQAMTMNPRRRTDRPAVWRCAGAGLGMAPAWATGNGRAA
jgi:hypothetical protein